jgi:hypothetical protein
MWDIYLPLVFKELRKWDKKFPTNNRADLSSEREPHDNDRECDKYD